MRKKRLYIVLAALVCTLTLLAQNVTMQGVVTDKGNGEPLIGATVLEKGTNNGTVTDMDGNFSITASPQAVLVISYIGYTTQEMPIRAQTNVRIQLASDTEMLEEFIVVGYGTQRVKDMTAPIAMVKGSDLTRQMTANPMSALQGKMSGVQIVNSGVPGAGPNVKIRGIGSIGDYANPLYVVDGVFVDNIDFLSSGDIEDLTVLKDASAAAIYGVRAANGVVLVTTKTGKIDQTNISYEGYYGIQVPVNVMPLANREQYVELLNLANINTPGYVPRDAANYPASTDWYRELLRNAAMHNHAIDISGATEKTSYSLGMNYFYQEGIMNSKNDYERYNFRARIDQNVSDWLKMGFNTVISDYRRNNPNNNAFFSAFINPPVYNVYDDANEAAYPVKFASPQQYGYGNQYGNPVAAAYYNNSREDGLKMVFSTFAEFSLIPKLLTFRTSYNLDFGFWKSQGYTPEFNVGGSQGVRKSNLNKTFGVSTKQIIDNLLTYTNASGPHNYTLLLGQSTRLERQSTISGTAQDVPGYDDQSIYLTTGSFRDRYSNDSGLAYNGLSFFTRGTYNYNDRYLATFTFRADGSSKYQEKWGYFPSLGLGWILTGENFMENQNTFDYLKLRGSWGLLGNDNVPANSSVILGASGAGSSAIFGDRLVDGVGAQTVVQRFLRWEVVSEFNIGIDYSFDNLPLKGELDYYNRITNNVVFFAPIATGGGVAELLSNNGTVQNQGFEFSINWTKKVSDNTTYNVGFNATTISNKVLKLEGREYIPGASVRGNFATRTQVGLPIGAFWGYETVGVYASESEALRDPVSQDYKREGFFKYKDQNGDNVINSQDEVYLGSAIPKFIAGLDMGMNYRRFDFSITLQGQLGNKVLNAKRMNRDVFADANYDLNFYENAWKPGAPSKTYPSAEAYTLDRVINDFFVEDASYFRIQNIQVGYTFAKVAGISALRIYASAQRPFTYFGYNGFTPEVSGSPISNGVDTSVYPMQAVYSIGLKMNL